jgi:O-antigen/teichoic acid export membrane protein
MFPIMILTTLLAKPLVLLLLTEKWILCVPLMQWLLLSRMFLPLSAINMNVLNALGRSDLYMKLDLSKIPLDILILAITIPIGVEAITIGSFVNSFICFFINAYLPGRLLGYGCFKQLFDWRYIFLSVAFMTLSVLFFLHFIDLAWMQLLVGGIIGIIVYTSCCYLFGIIDDDLLRTLKIKK